LELAVQQDDSCALCWAVLAHLYADGVIYNYPTVPDPLALAHDYVERSLALDPNCQHAWMTKAWLGVFARNKTATIEYLEKCDAINPNSSIFKAMYSLGMAFLGEYEKSLALKEKALPLNPLPYWWLNLPNIFVALKKHDYSRALYYARKIGTPQVIYEHIFELIALYYLGETDMLRNLALKYRVVYPSGFDFMLKAFPAVLFDEDLVRQLTLALQEIRKIIGDNEVS
jgi:tetratricopeptide (TPR) repeat protein